MTINRANPPGWGVGDKLTSAQENQVDINTTYALDKRSGQTDTLESIVSCVGAGRVIPTFSTGWNADTTVTAGGGNSVIYATGVLTADRIYTLSATGAQAGDTVTIINFDSSFLVRVKDQSAVDLCRVGGSGDFMSMTFVYTGAGLGLGWQIGGARRPDLSVTTALSSGTYVAPYGVTKLLLIGWGAGGGGGAGYTGVPTIDNWNAGGAGGGGALGGAQVVTVGGGTSYPYVIGTGGTGANTGGASGGDGGDTTFDTLATFPGAQGGNGGSVSTASGTPTYSFGGLPVRDGIRPSTFTGTGGFFGQMPAGSGAPGRGANSAAAATAGSRNPNGYAGGVNGTIGTDSGSYRGGGAGGGGGGGPGGAGGSGGNGSNGNSVAASAAGGNGVSAAANTGAGGGGAGACGHGQGGNGGTGTAGTGGSGKLIIIPLR